MEELNFDTYPQPEWNEPNSVCAALKALQYAHDEQSASEAYGKFLYAVGNNHAGTYYPVILAVMPQIERILSIGGIWSQRAVLESLVDLAGSFVPESGHESHRGIPVAETLRTYIRSLRQNVVLLTERGGAVAKIANDLLELIDDQAA